MLEVPGKTRKSGQALLTHTGLQETTQNGYNSFWVLLVLGQPRATRTHKTHHGPDLGEATTFPLIVFSAPRFGDYIQMALFPGSPEIPPCGTPRTLEPHNFASKPRIEVRSEAKLYLSSRAFQRYVARRL